MGVWRGFNDTPVVVIGHEKGNDTKIPHRTQISAWPAPKATAKRAA